MKQDPQTIERIVAEVVRRVAHLANESSPAPRPSAPEPAQKKAQPARENPEPQTPAAPPPDTLVLDARVITTATTHGRLKGIRRVVVGQRAVVTPSVQDELEKKRIRLERREPEGQSAAAEELSVVRYIRGADAARASATLPLPADATERVHEELADAVQCAAKPPQDASRVVVMMTDETLAAVCLLNRHSHVRAAQARSVDEVRKAVSDVGANVLVVDPREFTANQWNVTVKVFRSDLPRGCPAKMD